MSSDQNKKIDSVKLLKAIRDNPSIYKKEIDKSWERVSTIVDASVEDCKRKWSELRQGYEKSKSNKYKTYKYLEHIQFIDEYSDKNESIDIGIDADIYLKIWDMSLKDDIKSETENDRAFVANFAKAMESMTSEAKETLKKEVSELVEKLLKN